jgi:hypothetical protein
LHDCRHLNVDHLAQTGGARQACDDITAQAIPNE